MTKLIIELFFIPEMSYLRVEQVDKKERKKSKLATLGDTGCFGVVKIGKLPEATTPAARICRGQIIRPAPPPNRPPRGFLIMLLCLVTATDVRPACFCTVTISHRPHPHGMVFVND
jgi:hypothetical protein